MTIPDATSSSDAFDLLATLSTLEGVRNALRVPDVPMQELPTAAGRIRDELDDLRASMDEIRLLLDMPGAPVAQVVWKLERVCV